MPANDQVNWQPISQMMLIASMIDTSLDDTREHLATLTKARAKPHVLDDATIDRVERVHSEQMEFIATYTQQISRWRDEKPSDSQKQTLDRMATQNQQLLDVTTDVLALARELRNGTIARVLGMSDVELGLQSLLGKRPTPKR
jgi:signal transduction histidine kinase